MSVTDELLANAEATPRPSTRATCRCRRPSKVAVVACMDARLNPYGLLGLDEGDAHVIRNAGGVVTDDEIRSLAISQRLLGTEEIILIHHTDCGMLTFTDDQLRSSIEDETGIKPPWAAEAFTDLDEDVAQSIARIKASPFIPQQGGVRGFVYDVETGTPARGRLVVEGAEHALADQRAGATGRLRAMRNAAGMLKRWRIVVPAVALVALAATWGSKPGSVVLAVVALLLAGCGAGRSAPRRGRRAPGRRAVRLARPRRRRDGDRGRADRDADGVRRPEDVDARARHRLRRGDDHDCNGILGLSLLVGGARAAALATFNAEGTATALATVADARHAEPRAAERSRRASRARSSRRPQLALRRASPRSMLYALVRLRPDRAPPRLLPARRRRSTKTSTPSRRPTARRS